MAKLADYGSSHWFLARQQRSDLAKAVDYGKQIKLYPLSQDASPPQTTFVDMINVVFDATIPYDMRFFQSLDRMVQSEPWLPRDKVMIDLLRSIGIEKGKPFKPDATTQKTLNAAINEAHSWLNTRYETVFPPYYGAGQWFHSGHGRVNRNRRNIL